MRTDEMDRLDRETYDRHGRVEEAAAIWDAVARDTPEDVWVHNNAGSEYGAIEEHDAALSWLTRAGRDPSRTIPWPPGRNEPCWCRSGRKYKRCCGAPGSGSAR